MYSWAGQLYTALRTVCQGINGKSAGLTGLSGEKFAYGINEKLLLTKLMKASADVSTNYFCPRIARIYTNAMRFENGDLFGRTNLTNAMRESVEACAVA